MNAGSREYTVQPPRVKLTASMLEHLTERIKGLSVAELAERTGLPYLLIYNIVHRRIKSLSARHYQMIFGSHPPPQEQKKTDGTYFRELVDLWLLLNEGVSKSDLYWEFYGAGHTKRVDYRIFTGQTKSVDPEFVRRMEDKFSAGGIDRDTARRWAHEYAEEKREDPVAYERVRPLLIFLHAALGVHPTTVLNQWFKRYETGELKHVAYNVYAKVRELKNKAEKALASGTRLEIEKLKEEIYGRKPGYTLYAMVAEEIEFLRKYARRSVKSYLGRSTSMYARGECRRLPTWRAQKIMADCRALVSRNPHLALPALPLSIRKPMTESLIRVFRARISDLLSQEEGIQLEKKILRPSRASDEYKKKIYGFTRFDMAGQVLGMKKTAFDLMVARNCEIFRKIGTYSRRWYLSDLYLKELSQKQYFDLISTKYEWLAQRLAPVRKYRCLD